MCTNQLVTAEEIIRKIIVKERKDFENNLSNGI